MTYGEHMCVLQISDSAVVIMYKFNVIKVSLKNIF